jgi:hypothetical protein
MSESSLRVVYGGFSAGYPIGKITSGTCPFFALIAFAASVSLTASTQQVASPIQQRPT